MSSTLLPLSRNESYWLLEDERLEPLRTATTRTLSTYPEYGELADALSEYAKRPAPELLITPGSDAGIGLIAQWCARTGRSAILPVPTFYGYERILAASAVETRHVLFDMSDGLSFPEAAVATALAETEEAVLFLCQPNNPLGSLIDPRVVDSLITLAAERGTTVVIDEAYAEFENPSLIERADEHLVILRTFSKSFGLAGARVGYIVAGARLLDELRPLQLPWPVAHASVAAALSALELKDIIAQRRALLIGERDLFIEALAQVPGCTPLSSRTNFVFVNVGDGDMVAKAMREKGIAVAAGSGLSFFQPAADMLRSGIRLSIPSPQDREPVLRALTTALDPTRMNASPES